MENAQGKVCVKTNDGKDLGEIKKISEGYLLLQKGTVRKEEFWITRLKGNLWLLLSLSDFQ